MSLQSTHAHIHTWHIGFRPLKRVLAFVHLGSFPLGANAALPYARVEENPTPSEGTLLIRNTLITLGMNTRGKHTHFRNSNQSAPSHHRRLRSTVIPGRRATCRHGDGAGDVAPWAACTAQCVSLNRLQHDAVRI